MSAWVELIARDEHQRQSELIALMRAANHADKKGFDTFVKKLREVGS